MEPRAAQSSRRVAVASSPLAAARRLALAGGLALLASLGSLALPAGAHADTPPAPAAAAPSNRSPEEIEREAEAIARSIMSPFCPGRTVSACPVAGPWRDDIRKMVAEGVAPDEIKRRLAARVPEHNLMGVPKNRLGWALPIGLGVIAIGILVFLLRYLVGPRAGSAETPGAATSKDEGTRADKAPAAKGKGKDNDDDTRAEPESPAAGGKGDDYDERLKEELETLDQ